MQPANSKTRSVAEKTRLIKAEAARLGFDLCGVTTPEPPHHLDVLHNWLHAGRHGEMAYLATSRALERRADPRLVLPECRSILALGTGCFHPQPDPPPSQGFGQMAVYAWGEDYHVVLENRLQALAAFCETLAEEPFACRWYSDTGPILERELAQRAGLGWIGKNTCLINPRAGSHFLLSELFLSLELEIDSPITADHCGTCRRCIEACPTNCILPDRTLDARRCISYLTIEQKGPIPLDLRPQIGSWVFGCDICQAVCPWNQRFASPSTDPAFQPVSGEVGTPGEVKVDLAETLRLAPEQFNRRYKGSAVQRTRRRGLLRNAAVVLGNQSFAGAGAALIEALHDAEPLVRSHAAWALGQVGGSSSLAALKSAHLSESEDWVRGEIEMALQKLEV